jgi:uncharacterized protein
MQARMLHELGGQRTFVVVLGTGEEVMRELKAFAKSQEIVAARLTATGALSEAVLAYFDWEKQDNQSVTVRKQVEVASLIGEVASAPSGGRSLHIHAILAGADGMALAGYLTRAYVHPRLQITIYESPAHWRKVGDLGSGCMLIDPNHATDSHRVEPLSAQRVQAD